VVALFYSYTLIRDPASVARRILDFASTLSPAEVTGKIRLAREGINATAAASDATTMNAFLSFLEREPDLEQALYGVDYKLEPGCAHCFETLSVRVVDELCSFGEVNLGVDGECVQSLTPEEWAAEVRSRDTTKSSLLDVRNFYESRLGHFFGSTCAPIRRFSQFKEWLARDGVLEREIKDKDLYIFCTGGVRCEKVATYLTTRLPEGSRPRTVRKLAGGIVAYAKSGINERDGLFKGSNYVFDARGSTPVGQDLPSTSWCDGCGDASGRISKCVGKSCHVILIACERCGDTVYCCTSCRDQTERARLDEDNFRRRACECDSFESRERRLRHAQR
jgi:xeroderma pigmentosum group C-complementing protein